DEVFLQFGVKTQGVAPRVQFGEVPPQTGSRVEVVVERFDPEAGLLIVNREGAVQRARWDTLTVGSVVEGRVTGVIKGGLEVDLQGIRAFMPGSHADTAPMKDISVLLNETVRCEVIELDRREQNLVVSRRRLIERERKEAAEKLKAELEVGQVRTGVVKNITEFGAFVDLGGVEGLVHIRDLSWGTVEKVSDVLDVGQEVRVQVLKLDQNKKRISLGLKQAMPDPWKGAADRYPVGTNLKVRIVRLADFGAFAELEPGVEGLIPLSEMSWSRVSRPHEVLSVGQMVDAVVIRMDEGQRRAALSIKQAQPDPWDGVLDGFSVDSKVAGKVTRITGFGAFVEVAPGVEGLIHISEMSERRVRTVEDVVRVGQEVEARVLGVDKENRRISLSLKPAPDEAASVAQEPAKPKKKRKKPLRGGLASHFEW
ncbi:MAG: S1 RNA-binding domain-containing protein, partial [Planctomycetota bacterium]